MANEVRPRIQPLQCDLDQPLCLGSTLTWRRPGSDARIFEQGAGDGDPLFLPPDRVTRRGSRPKCVAIWCSHDEIVRLGSLRRSHDFPPQMRRRAKGDVLSDGGRKQGRFLKDDAIWSRSGAKRHAWRVS